MRAIAARHGLRIKKTLSEGAVLQANAAGIEALAADVDHLSRDVEVTSFMSVIERRDRRRPGAGGARGPVAVHRRGRRRRAHRLGRLDRPPLARRPRGVCEGFRQRRHADRPGQGAPGSNEDPYGHGTHIGATSPAARRIPQDSTSQTPFRGVAPGANLISLRVIGADGTGKASDVIDAIEWVIQNRKRFNIRVINLSLGGPAEQSYRDDPMCEAVERAVHAGIVVVAAAGNRGKDAEGRSVHGLIESPGIDPYVITVGALNTKGTARAVGR